MPVFPGVAGDVHYQHWPAADARAQVVFLHGFGEHSGLYHRLAAALNGQRISLWALDEIGHGLSAGERGVFASLDDLADDGVRLTALAARAEPGLPQFLAGHSVGAITGALLAARDPGAYAGYVLSGSLLSPAQWVLDLRDGGDLDLDPAALSTDPWYLDALEHDPLAFVSAASAGTLAGALPPAWDELARTLPDLDRPLLLLHGELDPVAPLPLLDEWLPRLPQARLAVFPGALHDVLNESVHEEVALTIAAFVRRHALDGSAIHG